MENSDNSDLPLTPAEVAAYRLAAEQGKTPSLGIVRRFVLTIRKTFLANPAKVEKSKVSRNTKPVVSENQIDFF